VDFASLGSGSAGNGTVIRLADRCVMIDCGFSLRETTSRLATLGLSPTQVTDVLVTHEHSDHLAGVALLANRCGANVHLTEGTINSPLYKKRPVNASQIRRVRGGDRFLIGDVEVEVIAVPHDANEPVQFTLTSAAGKLGVISDLGHTPMSVVQAYRGCNALLLEHNHDSAMLAHGPYPYSLKKRVGGPYGHLSNLQAVEFLQQVMHDDLQQVVAIHLSETNNADYLVKDTVEAKCGNEVPFTFRTATQGHGFGWMSV
jgi:phosphoribosyl 1,2-cyclic phosphodiesterase